MKAALDFDTLLMMSPCFAERRADAVDLKPTSTGRKSGKSSVQLAAGGVSDSPVDVGVGWEPFFRRFEEEIFMSKSISGLSFTFPVASDPVDSVAIAPAPAVSAGKKRSRELARAVPAASALGTPVSDAAAPSAAEESISGTVGSGPRPPQFRHVFAFPVQSLAACVHGMEGVVEAAAASAGAAEIRSGDTSTFRGGRAESVVNSGHGAQSTGRAQVARKAAKTEKAKISKREKK